MVQAIESTAARPAALIFIYLTVAFDALAMGLVIPVLPSLMLGFLGQNTVRTAEMMAVFGTAWSVMQFFCSPVLGALSDRFGRRPVILISNFGLGLDYVLMALAPGLGLLFVGRIISGITSASMAAASAYIADAVPEERRAAAFGMSGMCGAMGFVFGPALGGMLALVDLRLPFWVAAAASLGNGLYGWLILPESLKPALRARFRWHAANPIGALALLRSHRELFGLSAVMVLANLAQQAMPAVFVLYAAYRYGWSAGMTGLCLTGFGLSSAVVNGLLVKPATRLLGDRGGVVVGTLIGMLGFIILGLAWTGWVFLLGVPMMALFWGLSGPALQGLMTRRVLPTEQGQLQGASTSLMALTGLIGPGLFSAIFAYFIDPQAVALIPGAPFLLAAALMAGSALLAVRVTRPQ